MNKIKWAENIPSSYNLKAKKQGKLEYVEYETIDYTNDKKITKSAVVYLPFGYDENEKYNVY